MKRETAKLMIAIMIIALIIAAILLLARYLRERRPILLQGTTQSSSYRASSRIAGRIEDLIVQEGDSVTAGTMLYRISAPSLDAKLQQAEATERGAQALDRNVLAGARREQIEAALNLWQQARAGRILAEKSLHRVNRLYNEGVVTAQKRDEVEAQYQAMQASEGAAEAQYKLALAGATRNEKAAAAAQVAAAQGVVAEVESYIEDTEVYAPATGVISTIAAEEGELVGSGFPVVTIIDTESPWVEFNIKESLLPRLPIGRIITAYIPALDRYALLVVRHIAPQANFATWSATRSRGEFDIRTFVVKMYPMRPIKGLRPGMSATINYNLLK